jgi:CBS domain-containing protein
MVPYRVIEIFADERSVWKGRPLSEVLVDYVREFKIAARCLVFRAVGGCFESGEVVSRRLEVLSYNMPLRILIVTPAKDLERLLPGVVDRVTDGIVAVQDLHVVSHKIGKRLLPDQLRVKDIMTADPATVTPSTPLDEVVRVLLSSIFTGVPVVDESSRPIGIITQGDLIYKGGMPLRLGLLVESGRDKVEEALQKLSHKRAGDVMTSTVVSITEDKPVTHAVELMMKRGVKRFPVTDSSGRLSGMLSRLDIFRTIMKDGPDWKSFEKQNIKIDDVPLVSDITRRDTHKVLPETPVEEVIRIIDSNDIQRVAVVDGNDRLIGIISDRDLLMTFSTGYPEGIRAYLTRFLPFTERGRRHREFREYLRANTAADVMNINIVSIREDAEIDEAIQLMLERGFKRLPVVDSQGRFKGMISRDAILRTGFVRTHEE